MDKIINKFIAFAKSNQSIVIATLISLFCQIDHAAYVFFKYSKNKGIYDNVVSYLFAVALEMAVFLFMIRGKRNVSLVFAFISIALNIFYYTVYFTISYDVVTMIVLSLILPFAIAMYSHEVEEYEEQVQDVSIAAVNELNEKLNKEVTEIKTDLSELGVDLYNVTKGIIEKVDTKIAKDTPMSLNITKRVSDNQYQVKLTDN